MHAWPLFVNVHNEAHAQHARSRSACTITVLISTHETRLRRGRRSVPSAQCAVLIAQHPGRGGAVARCSDDVKGADLGRAV